MCGPAKRLLAELGGVEGHVGRGVRFDLDLDRRMAGLGPRPRTTARPALRIV